MGLFSSGLKGAGIVGVDKIRFDDTYVNGQKINLGLGVDTRPMSVKYHQEITTIAPLVGAIALGILGLFIYSYSVMFVLTSLFLVRQWRSGIKKYRLKHTSIVDTPKYLTFSYEASLLDFSPKNSDAYTPKGFKSLFNKKADVGTGVFFFGHELFTGQEVHLSDDKVRTHIIIFGTTGSGKTENILSICVNFMIQASGFILVDGKGDTLLFYKVFALCRAFGRTDDIYVLNFMESIKAVSTVAKSVEINSNSFNLLVESTADEASEIIGGLLSNDGNSVWSGRAAAGISALNRAVYWKKDHGYLEIDPDMYRDFFALQRFAQLATDETVPIKFRKSMQSLLESVAYTYPTESAPTPEQGQSTKEQWQYIVMQYTDTFNMLADTYRAITMTQTPDVSITDIVLRRRVLLVLLPSLAKSDQSVRNLGRILIAMARNVAAKAIGPKLEGTAQSTRESKSTAAISSYGLIFDEFGTYAVVGAATLPAQVRSLNMVCIFAGQDYEAFKSGDEKEAATIFANCTIKIAMKLEDPLTFEKFKESAGETYVLAQQSYETTETIMGGKTLRPAESRQVEKRSVLHLPDLKKQSAGQQTLLQGDRVIRMSSFYADVPMTPASRLNRLLEVRSPTKEISDSMHLNINTIHRALLSRVNGDWEADEESLNTTLSCVSSYSEEIQRVYSKINQSIKSDPVGAHPTLTQQALFAMSVLAKRVELIDMNIKKGVADAIGFGDDFDDGFDDDALLTESESQLSDLASLFAQHDLMGNQNYDEEDDEDVAVATQAAVGLRPVAETAAQLVAPKTSAAAQPQATKEQSANVAKEIRVDPSVFDRMEDMISRKGQELKEAEKRSFDSLKAIDMDVFAVQRQIAALEDVFLRKAGYNADDAKRMAELSAQHLIVDMGHKTNPIIVGQKDNKTKNPNRSRMSVRDLVNDLASKA